jgi:hypothetical protein
MALRDKNSDNQNWFLIIGLGAGFIGFFLTTIGLKMEVDELKQKNASLITNNSDLTSQVNSLTPKAFTPDIELAIGPKYTCVGRPVFAKLGDSRSVSCETSLTNTRAKTAIGIKLGKTASCPQSIVDANGKSFPLVLDNLPANPNVFFCKKVKS